MIRVITKIVDSRGIYRSYRTSHEDISGKKFGAITVLGVAFHSHGNLFWKCICTCGNEKFYNKHHLKNIKNCGCEKSDFFYKKVRTHGLTKSPTYRSWISMKARCTNPNLDSYSRYGGRGIRVCKRWVKFENFLKDMGERPKNTSLDRINNDGNYNPRNCRWGTVSQQQRNRSNNRKICFRGETKNICEWVDKIGIGRSALAHRLRNKKWTKLEVFTTPTIPKKHLANWRKIPISKLRFPN